MAINKISSPLADSPSVFAAPVVNQLLALVIDCNHGVRVSGGYVKKGSMWNIGGAMFIADSDTLIGGTRSSATLAIKFIVSGSVASATYTDTLNSATWDGEYQGWYDTSGNLYYFECSSGEYTLVSRSVSLSVGAGADLAAANYKVDKTGCFRVKTIINTTLQAAAIYVNGTLMTEFLTGTLTTDGYVIYHSLYLECGDVITVMIRNTGGTSITSGIAMDLQSDYFGIHQI